MARVPANSYGDGTVYLGGNKKRKPDGTIETIVGYHTSPSGKRTYTSPETGHIMTLATRDIERVGTVVYNDEIVYEPSEIMTEQEIMEEAKNLANGQPVEKYIEAAIKKLGGKNKAL